MTSAPIKRGTLKEEAFATLVEKGGVETTFEVAFIGAPGMGKSTILNIIHGLNEDGDDVFTTGCSLAGVTDEVKEVVCKKEGYSINLIDTMGWPDPDPTRAKTFYDKVIKDAVNRKLHCLVWVVNNERSAHKDIAKKYSVFMREFKTTACKMLLIVNGKENYASILKHIKKLNQERAKATETMMNNARTLLKDCKLETTIPDENIIICTDLLWMEENILRELHERMKFCEPKRNDVRTFELIELKYKDDKNLAEQAKKDKLAKIVLLKQEIEELETTAFHTKAWAVGLGAAAVGSAVAGFFTFGLTFGLTATAGTASTTAATVLTVITFKLESARAALASAEAEVNQSAEESQREIAALKSEFDEFNNLFK